MKQIGCMLFVAAMSLVTLPAMAHVAVGPKKVGIADWVTFIVSVPNEKDTATTQIKLVVPPGLDSVLPTVKPGWKTTVEKDAQGQVTAIVWVGSLPPEFRDDFTFSAHVPGRTIDLAWKAYQTYEKGELVSWDIDPTSEVAKDPEALEKNNQGPYSVTQVVDDLTPAAPKAASSDLVPWLTLALSVLALIVAAAALARSTRRPVSK